MGQQPTEMEMNMAERTIPMEDLKLVIQKLQKAVNELRLICIRESVLHFLIQRSAGTITSVSGRQQHIPITHIRAILSGIENLEEYVYESDD
jgi:hypothetical protein